MGKWLLGVLAGVLGVLAVAVIAGQDASVEVRIGARNLEDGRVELALQGREASGDWGERVLPSARYLPVGAEGWKYSSAVTVSGAEVRVAALRVSRGVRLALQVRGDSDAWGDLQHPRARVLPSSIEGWRYSSTLNVSLATKEEGAATAEAATTAEPQEEEAPPAATPPSESSSQASDSTEAPAESSGASGASAPASGTGAGASSGADGGQSGSEDEEEPEAPAEQIGGASDAEVLAAGWFADVRVAAQVLDSGDTALRLHYRVPTGDWKSSPVLGRLPSDAVGWQGTREQHLVPVVARTCLASLYLAYARVAARNEDGGNIRVAVQRMLLGGDQIGWAERVVPDRQLLPRQTGEYLSSIVRLAIPAHSPDAAPGPGEMSPVDAVSVQNDEDGGLTPADCYQPRVGPPVATVRIEWWPGTEQGNSLNVLERISSGSWQGSGGVSGISSDADGRGWQYGNWFYLSPLYPETEETSWLMAARIAWRVDDGQVRAGIQRWLAPGQWGAIAESSPAFDLAAAPAGNRAAQVGDVLTLESPEEVDAPSDGWMN